MDRRLRWLRLAFQSARSKLPSDCEILCVCSREQALRLYTSAASHYTFEEAQKGTIRPGKLADFVVLSADYMAVPEEQIKDIKADLTLVGGKVVFQR